MTGGGEMTDSNLNGLILAAGLSRRMGEFKPLLPLGKKTILETTIDSMLPHVERIVVVLGYRAEEIEARLAHYPKDRLILVRNPEYETADMLTSIKCGLREMPPCQAFYLLPGDMPNIDSLTFKRLKENALPEKSVIFPTIDGYRKHPPLIHYELIGDILNFSEDGGLRQLWKRLDAPILEIPVNDPGCSIDLDTPEQYHRYHF